MKRILIAILALSAVLQAAQPGGSWQGAIELPTGRLPISIELEKKEGWSGTINIPSQGIRDKALANVQVDGDQVRFELPGIPGDPEFAGLLGEGGASLAGTFSQAGTELKFSLQRVEKVAGPPIEKRVERLVEQLEQKREEYHIPGMAIAVVKDGKVILSRGFGLADVANKEAVTPETIFAIGSTTKAFTATATGMLIDEGKMTWDDRVTRHLADFNLPVDSDDEGAEATIRDLLAHRTGFARMGVLWASGQLSRDEILSTALKAKPWAKHREQFQYCNVTYLAAGQAAAAAAGTDWDTLVAERIFKPLGMTSSNTSYEEAQADSRLSTGYLPGEEPKAVPMRNLQSIGPAGSINSNAIDMAKWVQFLLAGGVVGEKRLISVEQLEETRRAQIGIGGGVEYGMGWMIRSINGWNVIEHGGNIDGFGAQVGLFPKQNLGFVLLTNLTASPLQSLSNNLVGDVLLGEWSEEAPPVDAKEFEPFVGKYIGNFAHFKNSEFEVLVKNGKLAVDVPGQITYELKSPNDEGKWVFAITDAIAVSFDREGEDAVVGMKMYQGGATFELPRKGVRRKDEVDPAEVKKFLGKYKYSEDTAFEIAINHGRLSVDIPGKIRSDLHPPDKDGKWKLRVINDRSLRFDVNEEGVVESLTLFREGRDPRKLPRLAGEDAKGESVEPSVDEILALRKVRERGAAFAKLKSLRLSASIDFVNAGVEGTQTILMKGPDRFRFDMDLGRCGYENRIITRTKGWTQSNLKPSEELTGTLLEQTRQGNPTVMFGDWSKHFEKISVLPSEKIEGKTAYVLHLKSGDLPPITVWVDAESGDLLQSETRIVVPAMNVEIPTTVSYQDHRESGGIRMPWKSSARTDMTGRIMTELKKVETDVELDDALFENE